METATLPAIRRSHLGTKHARRLRQTGKLPAIIYGHGEKPEAIAIESHDLEVALQHHSRVVKIALDGDTGQYLIKAVQYDHLGSTLVHMDLVRVHADERVTVSVEIEIKGVPKGAHDGGVLIQHMNNVEVECPVHAIPGALKLSAVHLALGESLTIADLAVPEGVRILAAPAEKIATVRIPTEVEEAPQEPLEGAAAVEPEVIGRGKEEPTEPE
jgi:large subunit ribosomal protein L25